MYPFTIIEWLIQWLIYLILWTAIIALLLLLLVNFIITNMRFRKFGIPQPVELPYIGYGGKYFLIRVLIGRHFNDFVTDIYRLAKGAKYVGFHIFKEPIIAIRDPDLVKNVLVTYSNHFTDYNNNRTFIDGVDCPVLLHTNAFCGNNQSWEKLRHQVRSILTPENMCNMYGPISQCAGNFIKEFTELYSVQASEPIDMKDVFSRYASDAIAALFDIRANSLREREDELYAIGKRFMPDAIQGRKKFKVRLVHDFNRYTLSIYGLYNRWLRNTDSYVNEILIKKVRTTEVKGHKRPNIIKLLMDANFDYIDIKETVQQVLMCFLSRLETTSVQMCLVAHQLATHPEVQRKLQEEIDTTLNNGKLTYSIVNNMVYLNAVFKETFRIHPVTKILTRSCIEYYELPPARQGATSTFITAGSKIIIPIAEIHKDPQIYNEPDIFRPERFLGPGCSLDTACDLTNLNFGLGPSVCLGNKFSVIMMKVMFVNLLAKFTLMSCDKTWSLVYDIKNSSQAAKGGFWLQIRKR